VIDEKSTVMTKALLACGAIAGPLFVVAFLFEGATHANYDSQALVLNRLCRRLWPSGPQERQGNCPSNTADAQFLITRRQSSSVAQ
jgi:hypothetical protein